MADFEKLRGDFRDKKEYYRKHRLMKAYTELLLKGTIWFLGGDSESTRGLLTGSIVGHDVTYPDPKTGKLTHRKISSAGDWVGFDFNRAATFPHAHKKGKVNPISEGRVVYFLIDEVRNNEPDDLTPTDLFRLSDLDHIFEFNTASPAELVDQGLMALRSHDEAYAHVGLYDQFGQELRMRGVEDEPVFQVTPKGNTLVRLMKDSGDPEPEPERAKEAATNWLPGLRPAFI